MNLRSRILQSGIRCQPWRIWKGEIDLLPISSKTLFRNEGTPIDLLEIALKSEGYLLENEDLLEVIKIEANLKRRSFDEEEDIDSDMPDYWTEEDYEYYYKDRR